MDPRSRASKKNTSHGNEVLPQDTTYLLQRPRYQPGSLYYDPAINRTTQRPLTIVKRRKLKWYGHVSRSPGLDKTTLQGKVKGGRRQGRQKKRLEDNIREWTRLEFAKSHKTVENREKWRKLIVKSSVVPQRPSRLRDRCLDEGTSDHWDVVTFFFIITSVVCSDEGPFVVHAELSRAAEARVQHGLHKQRVLRALFRACV